MGKPCYNSQAFKQCTGGSMDRASDSGSEGWGFESLPVCQKEVVLTDGLFLVHRKDGLERTAQTK